MAEPLPNGVREGTRDAKSAPSRPFGEHVGSNLRGFVAQEAPSTRRTQERFCDTFGTIRYGFLGDFEGILGAVY